MTTLFSLYLVTNVVYIERLTVSVMIGAMWVVALSEK